MPAVAPTIAALIVAAGRGSRTGMEAPKQYAVLAGQPVLRRTVAALRAEPRIGTIRVVIHPDDEARFAAAAGGEDGVSAVAGGATRQASVRLGLESLAGASPKFVLIHDAVRPFSSPDLISRIVDALSPQAGVVPILSVADTVKRIASGRVIETVSRDGLHTVQTPQAFPFGAILAAHRANADRDDLTDDAAVAEAAGLPVKALAGDPANVKLTFATDFAAAERRLRETGETRIGQGFDVHAFGPGDHVMLGGVRIDHSRGLVGHSDADVALHALTDALLGAVGDGDIGTHFPPSDPAWQGIASSRFVADAVDRLRGRGGRIVNVDLTIVCETPKVAPHRDAMAARIAGLLGIDPVRVGIKATTSEGLGFTGRGEGIAAFAVASVRLPAAP